MEAHENRLSLEVVGAALLLALAFNGCAARECDPGFRVEAGACVADASEVDRGQPRFTFHPEPPGRAVGIRAIVELADGTEQSREIEIDLVGTGEVGDDVHVNSAALRYEAGGMPSNLGLARAPLCDARVGDDADYLGAIDGRVCWVTSSVGIGALSLGRQRSRTIFFAREGRYLLSDESTNIYFPPDLINAGAGLSVGCIRAPDGDSLDYNWFSSLVPLTFSHGFFPVGLSAQVERSVPSGFTFFLVPGGHGRSASAVQYNTAASLSLGLAGVSLPISVALGVESTSLFGPTLTASRECIDASNAPSAEPAMIDGASEEEERLIADSLEPLIEHLMQPSNQPAGPHVVAGSNADAFATLGERSFGSTCADCPASTLDDLVNECDGAGGVIEHPNELVRYGARILPQVPNVLPSTTLLDILLRRAQAGVMLASHVQQRLASNGVDVFIAHGVVTSRAFVGQEVALTFTPEEVAELIGRTVDEVIGATLEVSGVPQVETASAEMPAEGLSLTFTPETSGQAFFRATVDLSTADSAIAGEAADWYVEVAPRIVTIEAGEATQLGLVGPAAIASGGSVALNAVVVDDHGNPVEKVVHVRFEDAFGKVLGEADTEHGVAMFQYVPLASTPEISAVVQALLRRSDTTLQPGVAIEGGGFSGELAIFADGVLLDLEEHPRTVLSSTRILLGTQLPVGTRVHVVNPGGQRSAEIEVVAQ